MPLASNILTANNLAILRLTNGVDSFSLLGDGSEKGGFMLRRWRPQIAEHKGGGTFQDTPLAEGRRLVSAVRQNVVETFELDASECDQEVLIDQFRRLLALIEYAKDYWTSEYFLHTLFVDGVNVEASLPLWLEARAQEESNTRYCIVQIARVPDFENPYGPAFNAQRAIAEGITLQIERDQWRATPPNETQITLAGTVTTYNGRTLGNALNNGTRQQASSDTFNSKFAYIGNKRNIANITHVYNLDASAGTYSANLMDAVPPYLLFPNGVDVGDTVYFGINTALADSGPFDSLVFYWTTQPNGITAVWEWFDGVFWNTLDVQDNTALTGSGIGQSVHWVPPTNWMPNAINGVTAYWVRARATAIAGAGGVNPVQGDQKIYTITWGYTELLADEVGGDITALMELTLTNASDRDGHDIELPDLWANRVIVGIRSNARNGSPFASEFDPYINVSDEQNQGNIASVVLGTNTTFVTDTVFAPSGRAARYSPLGTEAMATRAAITLTGAGAVSYFGEYRAFLRVQQLGGAVGDLSVQLEAFVGTGQVVIYTSEVVTVPALAASNLLDMGNVKIPPDELRTQIGGAALLLGMGFNIKASAANTNPDLYIYDLILMPIDEWGAEFVDTANNEYTMIGNPEALGPSALVVDSVRYHKDIIRAVVTRGGEFMTTYRAITSSPAILQASTRTGQRLYVLTARRYSTSVNDDDWRSNHGYVSIVKIRRTDRYLAMRGNG